MRVLLETTRLILREFESTDSEIIRKLDSDPEVMKYISNGIPSDDTEVQRAIRVTIETLQKHQGAFGYWMAIEKSSNEIIGWFHLRPLKSDPDNTSIQELGYRLFRKFWNQGFATEGSLALIKYAKTKNVQEVWAHSMSANTSSQNVMKKCGLEFSCHDTYPEFPGEDKQTSWFKLKLT